MFRDSTTALKSPATPWRLEKRPLAAVFLVAFSLYAVTAPRSVTLEDDALFIGVLHFAGVGHPPGYPAYTFLGGLFYRLLPFLAPAYKAHLFSAVAAAAACCAVYAVVSMLVNGRWAPYLAAFSFAVSKTLWSQAIIADVYALNAFFFFLLLALCMAHANGGRRLLPLIAVVYGLGLANHYPLLVLATPGLAILVFPRLRQSPLSHVAAFFLALATAAILYLWMVWRSHQDINYNFFGGINDMEQFWFYFLRRSYADVDHQLGADWGDKLEFVQLLSFEIIRQFTPVGFLFVVAGFVVMMRRNKRLCLAMSLSFLCSSFLLVALLDFEATFISFAVFRVYPVVAYGIMAIWLSLGAAQAVSLLSRRAIAAGFLLPFLVGQAAAAHWHDNNRSDYRWAKDLAISKLNTVESGASLFLYDDLDFPVGYLHYVEKIRPDLKIYDSGGIAYRNRLYSVNIPDFPSPDAPLLASKAAILRNFINITYRPTYFHPQQRELFYFPSDFTGFYNRVRRDGKDSGAVFSSGVLRWLQENMDADAGISDAWTKFQLRAMTLQIILTLDGAEDSGVLPKEWRDVLARARKKYPWVRIVNTLRRLNEMSGAELAREWEWARSFNIDDAVFLDKTEKSDFYVMLALLSRRATADGGGSYEKYLQTGLALKKAPDNPALPVLLHYYYGGGRYCRFFETLTAFYPQQATVPHYWRQATAVAAKHCFGS